MSGGGVHRASRDSGGDTGCVPTDTVTCEDHALARAVEALAADDRPSAARVVIGQGRLFVPAPWPGCGVPRRGSIRQCHRNALRVARLLSVAYVEGFAYADGLVVPHAWAARGDGTVLDPTWPDGGCALAYLGVPMTAQFVAAFQSRTMTRTRFPGVLDAEVQALRDAVRIYTDGVPAYGRVRIGRPLPQSSGRSLDRPVASLSSRTAGAQCASTERITVGT